MNMYSNTPDTGRTAALNGLAIIGFIALVVGGMWLAVYSARYVPAAVSKLGAAAVSLTQIFKPGSPSLSVVPTATTTIPFGNATTTATTTAPTPPPAPVPPAPRPTPPPAPTPGPATATTTIIGTTPIAPYGLPDFTVTITAVGYLDNSSPDSFVASHTVPSGERPAVKFTVKNIGTNVTGSWRFSADIPTERSYTYRSGSQQNLNPGDSIDYVLSFDEEDEGSDQEITIEVNYDRDVNESNTSNNSATVEVDIR